MAELAAGRGRAALHCRNDSIASVLAGAQCLVRHCCLLSRRQWTALDLCDALSDTADAEMRFPRRLHEAQNRMSRDYVNILSI